MNQFFDVNGNLVELSFLRMHSKRKLNMCLLFVSIETLGF